MVFLCQFRNCSLYCTQNRFNLTNIAYMVATIILTRRFKLRALAVLSWQLRHKSWRKAQISFAKLFTNAQSGFIKALVAWAASERKTIYLLLGLSWKFCFSFQKKNVSRDWICVLLQCNFKNWFIFSICLFTSFRSLWLVLKCGAACIFSWRFFG